MNNYYSIQKRILFLIIFCFLFSKITFSTIFYSRNGGGVWDNNTTWSTSSCGGLAAAPGEFPKSGDAVFICGGDIISVNNISTCQELHLSPLAQLVISSRLDVTINWASAISDNGGSISGMGIFTFNSGAFATNTFLNSGNISISELRIEASGALGSATFNNIGMITSPVLNIQGSSTLASSTFNNDGSVVSTTLDVSQSGFGTTANFNNIGLCTVATALSGNAKYTNASGSTLNFGGPSISLTTFSADIITNTVNYNSTTGNQIVRNVNYNNLSFSGTGNRTKTLAINTIVSGNLSIADQAIFNVSTYSLSVAGNWTSTSSNATPFISGTQTVTFNGSSANQIIGGTSSTTFNNVVLNNNFGTTPQFELGINTNIKNALTMTSGIVNLNNQTLNLGTAALTPGTLNHSPNTWMYDGTFSRWMGTAALGINNTRGHFPMGSLTNYHPLWLGYSALTSGGTVSVSHAPSVSGSTSITPYLDASWGNTVVGRSIALWAINSGNGFTMSGANGLLRFGGSGFIPFIPTEVNASLVSNTVGTHVTPSNTTATYFEVNRANLSQANINNSWHIGTANLVNSPLPIQLVSFNVIENKGVVDLTWSTASQINNDYFTIEKTKDGLTFETVTTVQGAGNSTSLLNYSSVDNTPYEGISYYRLRQTDFDGKFTFSDLEVVEIQPNLKTTNFNFEIFPNPSDGANFNFVLNSVQQKEVLVVVYDVLGKENYSKVFINSTDGKYIYALDMEDKLSSGIYVVMATSNKNVIKKKLIIK